MMYPCGALQYLHLPHCVIKVGVVAILFRDRDTMITIPDIEDHLLCVGRLSGMVEGRSGMAGLPSGMGVSGLKS